MKKVFLAVLLFTAVTVAPAQNSGDGKTEKKSRGMALDFSAGASLPLAGYGSSNQSDKSSGYAVTGFLAQAGLTWMGKNNLGLAVQYTFQHNPMKNAANLVFPNGIPDSVGSGSWTNHYLMLGPVFMMTIRRLYIEARVMGGVQLSFSPNFYTPDPADSTRLHYGKNQGLGFAMQISAGVGYTITRNLALKFNLSLLGGWPVAHKNYPATLVGYRSYYDPATGQTYSVPVYTAGAQYDVKKAVTTLIPTIGIVYRF